MRFPYPRASLDMHQLCTVEASGCVLQVLSRPFPEVIAVYHQDGPSLAADLEVSG